MSTRHWGALAAAVEGVTLPAAFVDLDALDRNVIATRERMRRGDITLRVASKSVRHVGLLRRILETAGEQFEGLMCYAALEADHLAGHGFDDLFVAYPTVQRVPLDRLAQRAADGATIWQVVDCEDHVDALAAAGRRAGVSMRAVIEVDCSYRPFGGRVHLGTRRSPIRDVAAARALARYIERTDGCEVAGIMAYEAHIAGVPDASPFAPGLSKAARALRPLAVPAVRALRAEIVHALRADGHDLRLINGGGTGSVESTSAETAVTEVSAGSAFVCSHLFDYYSGFELEPAAFFALEVCRQSDPGLVTCGGGGYIASGPPGPDRLPLPWLPAGLAYVDGEGAGEVQTPLVLSDDVTLRIGDPVFFRHTKAGELADRFGEYHLLRDGEIVAVESTYRGEGRLFL